METTGIIFKIEPDTFRILDQSGAVRLFRPSQIGNKVDTRRSVATDSEGYELRTGDHVKEVTQGVRSNFQLCNAQSPEHYNFARTVSPVKGEFYTFGDLCMLSFTIVIFSKMEECSSHTLEILDLSLLEAANL